MTLNVFQSTPSAWRETAQIVSFPRCHNISIHSLRMEGDNTIHSHNITAPEFQSTPSAWRETRKELPLCRQHYFISIHSLRMEGDQVRQRRIQARTHFNPLPPHGGRRVLTQWQKHRVLFQSTPSAWRETAPLSSVSARISISIHSLRMEGDFKRIFFSSLLFIFQSTPSAWRETLATICQRNFCEISIHSLRMEGDFAAVVSFVMLSVFQSTPSAWRETFNFNNSGRRNIISIHSLRMEGDGQFSLETRKP